MRTLTFVNNHHNVTIKPIIPCNIYDFRIPLHLFPVETQNKILEVEDVAEDVSEEETEESDKYIDSSSFRQLPAPVSSRISPAELTIRYFSYF